MKCRICGNSQENQIHEAREMMFGYRDLFRYFQCAQCECLQIIDILPDMSKYYPDNYYSYREIPNPNIIKKFLVKSRNEYAFWEKGLVGKFLYANYPKADLRDIGRLVRQRDAKILDVGCGTGRLLHSLRELGMNNLLGIDPYNAKDLQYKNGVQIQKKEIREVRGKWDLVMFHHSFEHIPNPLETLKVVASLLNPDGHCIIRIPTVSSYAWKHYGVNWVQLDAPRHIYLHSIKSMQILADQARLSLDKVVYDSSSFQFWGSEQYCQGIPLLDEYSYKINPSASIFSKREILLFGKRAIVLNEIEQGDQAIFYLRPNSKKSL
jgi:SAM-dependent methyltransferase